MSLVATIDCLEIEDTLFGEPQVVSEQGPDSECFCICACNDRPTKVNNSQVTSAAAWVGKSGS